MNNTQVDNAEDIDIVMPMYNVMEYSNNYSKKSGSLLQYCKDIPVVNNDDDIVEFSWANSTDSFNFFKKITGPLEIMKQKMLKYWYHSKTCKIVGELLKRI